MQLFNFFASYTTLEFYDFENILSDLCLSFHSWKRKLIFSEAKMREKVKLNSQYKMEEMRVICIKAESISNHKDRHYPGQSF